ncbi:hypothetical protein PS15p_204506 [Mucor circinelloides]
MATLQEKYTVNPEFQVEFDRLQKESIDLVYFSDKAIYSIQHTIDQLQHLIVIFKLRSKVTPIAENYKKNATSTSTIQTLPSLAVKSSLVDDIAKMIDVYNQLYYAIDKINSTTIKNLHKLGTQNISDDSDMEWYREYLRRQKTDAYEFSEEVKALKSLSDVAIAEGKKQDESPKEREPSYEEKIGALFLISIIIVIYIWYTSSNASKGDT